MRGREVIPLELDAICAADGDGQAPVLCSFRSRGRIGVPSASVSQIVSQWSRYRQDSRGCRRQEPHGMRRADVVVCVLLGSLLAVVAGCNGGAEPSAGAGPMVTAPFASQAGLAGEGRPEANGSRAGSKATAAAPAMGSPMPQGATSPSTTAAAAAPEATAMPDVGVDRPTIAAMETTLVGPLLGIDAPQADNARSATVRGTDLGLPVLFGSEAVLLFGDSYDSDQGTFNPGKDDIAGFFPIAAGDADRVPRLTMQSQWLTVQPHDQAQPLDMGPARTPVAAVGFGDTRWYSLFLRGGAYMLCDTDEDCAGLICDRHMGVVGPYDGEGYTAESVPCLLDEEADPSCEPPVGFVGLCRDITSSLAGYDAGGRRFSGGRDPQSRTETGLAASVGHRHEFGQVQDASGGLMDMVKYETSAFVTNKLTNSTMRATRSLHDFRQPEAAPHQDNILWIWGRPAFWADPEHGAIGAVYLGRMRQGELAQDGSQAALRLNYFVGMRPAAMGADRAPAPQWAMDQSAAVPLAADDDWETDAGITGHMSVIYVEELQLWIMLYGGGMPSLWHVLFGEEVARNLGDLADGVVKLRVARQPWGPWSAPSTVLSPSDPQIAPELVGRPGSDKMGTAGFVQVVSPTGILYGAQMFEPWTRVRDRRSVDIAWFVSTWNPYQVQQLKTTIQFSD